MSEADVGAPQGPSRSSAVTDVLARGWARFGAVLVLSYLASLVGFVVAANVGRGLLRVEYAAFTGPGESVPRWLALVGYGQGALLIGAAVVLAVAALLAGAVQATRSARAGEACRPWVPFVRGLSRVPAVSRGLLLVALALALATLLSLVLLLLSPITVPLAVVTAAVWLVRPTWRRRWMRWAVLVALPFAALAWTILHGALWLPFVVLDGAGARSALRASRTSVAPGRTARAFAGVVVVGLLGAGVVAGLAAVGAGMRLVGFSALLLVVLLVAAAAAVTTVLHEPLEGLAPAPRERRVRRRVSRLATSPAVGLLLVVALLGQDVRVSATAEAAVGQDGSVVVTTLDDSLVVDDDCSAACTLREAVSAAASGQTITFAVSGTVSLVAPLVVHRSLALDGGGQRVVLQSPPTGPALSVFPNAEEGGGGEAMPSTFVLRNLTVLGRYVNARGLEAASGNVVVESSTFTRHKVVGTEGEPGTGSAIRSDAHLQVRNSTFVDNSADPAGGTVTARSTTLSINSSTFVGNHGGGAVGSRDAAPGITNSLFAGASGGLNCDSFAVVAGNVSNDGSCAPSTDLTRVHLDDADLALSALADNGGPVDTIGLAPGSAAVGAGILSTCESTDARGVARVGSCDAGAYQSSDGTATTLTTSRNPAPFGQPVQVTVTVTHAQAVPTGDVVLKDGAAALGTQLLVNGAATLTVPDLSVGVHALTATYVPAGSLAASSGTLDLTVEQSASTTSLTVSPSPSSAVGGAVTLTAAVRNAASSTGTVPTGTVQFFDGTTALGDPVPLDSAGGTELVTSTLPSGAHTLSGTYSGSTGYAASTSDAVAHTVQSSAGVALTAPTDGSRHVYGVPVPLSATVTGPTPTPIGSVDFWISGGTSNTVVGSTVGSGGVATTSSGVLPVGEYEVRAAYLGDPHHAPAGSVPVDLTVVQASTTTRLAGPGSSTVGGQPATFTADVAATSSPAPVVGDVIFSVDGVEVATRPVTGGVATYAPTDLAVGAPHSVTARYAGTADFGASTSSTLQHSVTPGSTTTSLQAVASSVAGQAVDLVATVAPVMPSTAPPTGSVTFRADGAIVGTAATINGVATLRTTQLPVGTLVLTGTFAQTTQLLASTSAGVGHVVSAATTQLSLAATPSTVAVGQATTLRANVTVDAPGSGTPTGQVLFFEGATLLGSGMLSSGVATLSLTLPAGAHQLTATFAGDARFLGDDGAITVTVARVTPVVAISSVSPTPSRWGSPVTITATVVSPTGSTVTGDVDFSFGSWGNVAGTAAVVDGVATLVVSDLSLVRTVVAAHYRGDSSHTEAWTPSATDEDLTYHSVLRAQYPIVVTTETSPTAFGERVRVHARMTPVLGRVPIGVVRIGMNGVDFGGTRFDANGHATRDFYPMRVGDLRVWATAEADPWFEEAAGEYLGHTVRAGASAVTVAATPTAPTAGTPFTLTATVTPGTSAGVGRVSFLADGAEIGRADVDSRGLATAAVTFPARGTRTITAVYDGGHGLLSPATSAPLLLDVQGRALQINVLTGGALYAQGVEHESVLYTLDPGPVLPTGSLRVALGDRTLALTPLPAGMVAGGAYVARIAGRMLPDLEPGTYRLTVTYDGDRVFAPLTVDATYVVSPAPVTVVLVPPATSPAVAGVPWQMQAVLQFPGNPPKVPAGSLTIGHGPGACTVELLDGARSGNCAVTFDGSYSPQYVSATYSGDARWSAATSPAVALTVEKGAAAVALSTSYHPDRADGPRWTDSEPVTVTWAVRTAATSPPTGRVEVVTSQGPTSCATTAAGTCSLRFTSVASSAWVEVRYAGDSSSRAGSARVAAPVAGCTPLTFLRGGSTTTPPNCAGTKYVQGTRLDLVAPGRAGFQLAGWSLGPASTLPLLPSPIWLPHGVTTLEPRYTADCVVLTTYMRPAALPTGRPDPAPNCYDPQSPDMSLAEIAAMQERERSAGRMRYRTGTRVALEPYGIRLTSTLNGSVAWSGDGVVDNAVTMDRDREVVGDLDPSCRRFVVDGAPGGSAAITSSAFDTSQGALLAGFYAGRCTTGTGETGYVPGTRLRLTATAPAGAWFERWGSVEPLATHRAPTGVVPAAARPDGAGSTGTLDVVVPNADSAVSAFSAGISCYELTITVQDAVDPSALVAGSVPATVARTAATCPSWWLTARAVPSADAHRWYLGGTEVTLTPSTAARRGTIHGYALPQSLSFRGWSGDLTGTTPERTVRITAPMAATASWYAPQGCKTVLVKKVPEDGGEVIVSDLGDACPDWKSMYANVPPTPQAPLGHPVSFAAKPTGSLQPIWTVAGISLSSTEGCTARQALIEERYASGYESGRTTAEIERRLMEDGYLPGLVAERIQEEAAWRFERGYTQANVVGDLKTLGLLLASGMPAADRLRDNPCDSTERDTVLPAGQRVISTTVDGNMVYTAHFCQTVKPSVTVIARDGSRAPASAALLDRFQALFRSSGTTGNCPVAGWYRPGTTAVLGSTGTGVPGYELAGWMLDGVAAPAGPLPVTITRDGAQHAVEAVVRVECRLLTVKAEFGHTAYPLPNCPGGSDGKPLYAKGTSVTVTAGQSSGHVWERWHETGSTYNPVLAAMDADVTLTASFRAKTVGETITESVIDPALDALGIGAKKAIGGIAYLTKVAGQLLIEEGFLGTLSLIGTGLNAGFAAIGVQGGVLDGIVLGLKAPSLAFGAAFDGFDCVEEWAWGRSVPTFDDLKDTVTAVVAGEARTELQGVQVDSVVAEAQLLAAKMAAGDPAVLGQAYIAASGGGAALMVVHLALDIQENPDVWAQRAGDAGALALTLLEEEFGAPFVWENSAADAWTTGGTEFLSCMADNGRAVVGQ